jgi:4-amino-4-deoxy-L-arabinose transferase-like glycosyltransferase
MTIAAAGERRALDANDARWIFLVAVLVRLAYLALVHHGADSLRTNDSPIYEAYAAELVNGCRVGIDCIGAGWAARMPGYPLFLAGVRLLFGPDPFWVVLVQMLVDGGSCLLIAWLAGLLDRRLGLAAGLLAAVNLNMITAAGLVLTESLFLPPFIGGLIAVVLYLQAPSWRRALVAGLMLGLAMLVRSVLMFFLPVLLASLAIAAWRHRTAPRRTLGHLLLAALAAVLCVSPILARNVSEYGRLALVTQGGQHSLLWVAPTAREFVRGVPFDEGQAEMQARLARHLAAAHLTALPRNPFAAAEVMEQVASHALWELGPLGLAKAWLSGTIVNLGAPALISVPAVSEFERPHFYETPGHGMIDKAGNFAARAAGSAFFWLMVPAVLWTLLSRLLELLAVFRVGRPGGLPLGPLLYFAAVALYFIAITGPVTGVKYRLPLEPLLIILLASALVWLQARWRAARLRRRGA